MINLVLSPASAPKRVILADALRALAIIMVFVNHVVQISGLRFSGRQHSFDYLGIWGVNCFFVLSGFLLSGPYLEKLLGIRPAFPSTLQFLARRFLRIWPLYAFSVIAASVLITFIGRPFPLLPDIIGHLLFLQNFSPLLEGTINPPFWTMPVDVEFYVVLPLIAWLAIHATGRPRILKVRQVSILLCLICSTSYLFGVIESQYNPIASQLTTFYVRNILGMGSAFAFGACLSFMALARPAWRPNRNFAIASILTALILFVISARISGMYGSGSFLLSFVDPADGLSAACLLYGLQGPFAIVNRVTKSHLLMQMAKLAYAVYLLHYPIIEIVHMRILRGSTSVIATAELFVISLAVTIAIAIPVNRFVECPFLKLKNRVRAHKSTTFVAPLPALP